MYSVQSARSLDLAFFTSGRLDVSNQHSHFLTKVFPSDILGTMTSRLACFAPAALDAVSVHMRLTHRTVETLVQPRKTGEILLVCLIEKPPSGDIAWSRHDFS